MKLTKEAIKMLRRVRRHVLAEPKRMAMRWWFVTKRSVQLDYDSPPPLGFPSCGMVGCIGGTTEMFYRRLHPSSRRSADRILGLDYSQGRELFHDYRLVHAAHQQTPTHARAVAKHIDKFIAKYS